ncbi:MAG: flavin reductase family protein [Dehalococcoidia bacterium]
MFSVPTNPKSKVTIDGEVIIKLEISRIPPEFEETWPGQFKIFSWMEFVTAIPQAISVITTRKENGLSNACPQAWTTYTGDDAGYHVIFSLMNTTHTYKNILREKEFAVNFPGTDEFRKCMDTITNNDMDTDEITTAGLTIETAKLVNAPRIEECFLSLECKLGWHKPLHEGSVWHVFAGEVVHVAVDAEYTRANSNNRYGDKGYIYNIHTPTDPATGEQEPSKVGKIEPMYDM